MNFKQLTMRSKPLPKPKVSKPSKPTVQASGSNVQIPRKVLKLTKAEAKAVNALKPGQRAQARAGILADKQARREEYFTSPEYLERMEYRRVNREVKSFTWSDDGDALAVAGIDYSKRLYLKPHQWVNLLAIGSEILAAIEAKGYDLSEIAGHTETETVEAETETVDAETETVDGDQN